MKLFKFKDLEITPIKDWDKPYNKIVIPKGFRLIKLQELWDLLSSDKADKFLGKYKGNYNSFWCEQTKYAKKKNYATGLYLGVSLSLCSWYDDVKIAYSYAGGRVVFVKEKK